jgi:hypothetical protein
MELYDKVVNALQGPLDAEHIRLDEDDGVSGFVVSRRFEQMSELDRQRLIDDALRNAQVPLSSDEQRQILMIAGLTPSEYDSVGARIRVHRIREFADGSLEVLVHGGYSDAVYVKGALSNQKGVKATEPEASPGAVGILMTFRAKGSKASPLTKERAIAVLAADKYIQVMPSA